MLTEHMVVAVTSFYWIDRYYGPRIPGVCGPPYKLVNDFVG